MAYFDTPELIHEVNELQCRLCEQALNTALPHFQPDRIGYHYTRCMWAELYRELGEPELGWVICAGDEPAVKAYNPQLGFQRTKVLMHGDELCDHVFYVKKG